MEIVRWIPESVKNSIIKIYFFKFFSSVEANSISVGPFPPSFLFLHFPFPNNENNQDNPPPIKNHAIQILKSQLRN